MVRKRLINEKENTRFIRVKCWQCREEILVKYNKGTGDYVKKNSWHYWTDQEENKEKYICNACLLKFYYDKPKEYLKNVTDKRKRRIFTSYVYSRIISY